ncbi:HNH endonuclease [Rhizobium sp. WW_1]|nr:HNH endonuclease [Rhizobium sp. WW_1]
MVAFFRIMVMGKLSSIKPKVRPMTPRIGAKAAALAPSARRDEEQPWRKWYKTAAWQELRLSVLVRDMFTCRMESCGRFVVDTSQLVADHKIRHQGDHELFWDEGNLQTLCKHCHDSLKQREERSGFRAW